MTVDEGWELEVRPRHASRVAVAVAGVVLVAFVVAGVLLRQRSTGVHFYASDQVAVILIGVLLAAAVLLLTRPRLKVGRRGVYIRNVFGEKDIPWDLIRGVSFPDGKAWARVELAADDEYVPVLALRIADKEYAVDAVERFRALGSRYGADVVGSEDNNDSEA